MWHEGAEPERVGGAAVLRHSAQAPPIPRIGHRWWAGSERDQKGGAIPAPFPAWRRFALGDLAAELSVKVEEAGLAAEGGRGIWERRVSLPPWCQRVGLLGGSQGACAPRGWSAGLSRCQVTKQQPPRNAPLRDPPACGGSLDGWLAGEAQALPSLQATLARSPWKGGGKEGHLRRGVT